MTTQDKPAVGPLSAAKELERLNAYNPDDVDLEIIKQRVVAVFDALIRLAPTAPLSVDDHDERMALRHGTGMAFSPTAPADVSTKPLETNTSAEHVKETAKNEHVGSLPECDGCDASHRCMGVGNVCNPTAPVEADCGIHGKVPGPVCIRCAELGSPMGSTAPVEAGGSEREALVSDVANLKAQFERIFARSPQDRPAYKDGGQPFGHGDLRHFIKVLGKVEAALRPQPSGETREAVAARIRRLVSLADADFSFVAREVYVSKETDAILALLRPAAPGGGDDLRAACQAVLDDYQTSETHHPDHILIRRADFERIAVILSSIPASEGGEG